jgi:hypothetical protein
MNGLFVRSLLGNLDAHVANDCTESVVTCIHCGLEMRRGVYLRDHLVVRVSHLFVVDLLSFGFACSIFFFLLVLLALFFFVI